MAGAQAPATSPFEQAAALVGRLEAGRRDREAAQELHELLLAWREDLDAVEGTRAAVLVGAFQLANSLDQVEEPALDRLGALTLARSAAAGVRLPDELLPFEAAVDYAYALESYSLGRLEEVAAVFQASLRGSMRGTAYDFPARQLLVDVLRRTARWSEALEAAEEFDRVLSSAEAGAPEEARGWLRDQRARYHGSRAELEQSLGRLDLAQIEVKRQRELSARSADPRAMVSSAITQCDLWLLTQRDERVIDLVDGSDGTPWGPSANEYERALLRLFLGAALSEAEREDPDADPRAERELRALLDEDLLGGADLRFALRTLADLALREGDATKARAALEELTSLTGDVGTVPGTVPGTEVAFLRSLEARWELEFARGEERRPRLARARERLLESWPALLDAWGAIPLFPGGAGFLRFADRRDVLGTLMRLELALHEGESGLERALGHLLDAETMGTLARHMELEAQTLDEVRADLLNDRHGVLVWLPSKDRTHVFALDGEGIVYADRPVVDEVEGEVRDLVRRLRKSPAEVHDVEVHADEVDGYAREVSRFLLPPSIEQRLVTWDAVTVVGAQYLHGLPPGALRLSDDRWLGAVLAVDVAPSLTVAAELARRDPVDAGDGPRLALFATLDPGAATSGRWKTLVPRAVRPRELARLCEAFGEAGSVVVQGAAATREAVLSADLSRVPIVHVLAHGVDLEELERSAALALSGDDELPSILSCADAERAGARGVVLLSACATARGPERVGDDQLAHLGGAFLRGGARAVVVSVAPVELGRTLATMEVVHRVLAAGGTTAGALRAALREALASGDRFAPYHAVGFHVVGDGQRAAF